MEQAQLMAQQDIANQNVALQQQIANQQEEQAQETLQYQQQQAAEQQAQAQYQADLQSSYDTQVSQTTQNATNWINSTFAQYEDPSYYNNYEQNYINALMPTVQQQYGQAKGQLMFGLARSGMLNSQAHADQQGLLDQQLGKTTADISTQATQAAQNLQQQVGQQKQSLMSQIMATGALGQPVAPGTQDAITSSIDDTNRAIQSIQSGAQDQLAKIGQLPTSSSLGNIFGSIGTSIGNYQSGSNAYQIGASGGYGSGGVGVGPNAGSPGG